MEISDAPLELGSATRLTNEHGKLASNNNHSTWKSCGLRHFLTLRDLLMSAKRPKLATRSL